MDYSGSKYLFLESGIDEDTLSQIRKKFPFDMVHIDIGIKYLRYFLKLKINLKEDWWWLLKKVEKRISQCCK